MRHGVYVAWDASSWLIEALYIKICAPELTLAYYGHTSGNFYIREGRAALRGGGDKDEPIGESAASHEVSQTADAATASAGEMQAWL